MATTGDEVHNAMARFTRALDAVFAGDVEPMSEVWSHADDVTYLGPRGGVRTGWAAVLADWEAQAAMRLGGGVEPRNVQVVAGGDLAVATSEIVGSNTDPTGVEQEVRIRSTNTFRRETDGWKVIGTHTDPLPFLGD